LTKNYNSIKKSDIEMGERGYKMDFRQGKESVAEATESTNLGRWPANIILTHHPECECKGVKKVKSDGHHSGKVPDDGGIYKLGLKQLEDKGNIYAENGMEEVEDWECHPDCPIKILDKQSGDRKSNGLYKKEGVWANKGKGKIRTWHVGYDKLNKYDGESGGSSRFFYVAKASKSERNNGLRDFEVKQTKGGGGTYNKETAGKYGSVKSAGHNFHPTVKPIKLMQYLVRLITPPNGKVLDPFCGSGTTGIACKLEGFEFLGMELDPEYAKIADARIKNYKEDKEELLQETKQEDGKDKVNKYIQANLFK
jgi:site-specific DNA-methyltransferase (adenine-specific)